MNNDHQKILPKCSRNPPRTHQNQAQIDPKALSEPILGQCLKKVVFRTPKKRPKVAKEPPNEAPDRPNPLPNGAQDAPKSNFFPIFRPIFSYPKFALIFRRFFMDF